MMRIKSAGDPGSSVMMKILDLFCGAGGASMGLHKAGHDVVGVDIVGQLNYPFEFIKGDALTVELDGYDAYWASPPCQAYSYSTARAKKDYGKSYPDLIGKIRKRLLEVKGPFIIENVVGAPIRMDLFLCGCMFNLGVFRRRHFEIDGFSVAQPPHKRHEGKVGDGKYFRILNGSGCWLGKGDIKGTFEDWEEAMQIDWMTKKELTQAVPPAYAEYIGLQLVESPNRYSVTVEG